VSIDPAGNEPSRVVITQLSRAFGEPVPMTEALRQEMARVAQRVNEEIRQRTLSFVYGPPAPGEVATVGTSVMFVGSDGRINEVPAQSRAFEPGPPLTIDTIQRVRQRLLEWGNRPLADEEPDAYPGWRPLLPREPKAVYAKRVVRLKDGTRKVLARRVDLSGVSCGFVHDDDGEILGRTMGVVKIGYEAYNLKNAMQYHCQSCRWIPDEQGVKRIVCGRKVHDTDRYSEHLRREFAKQAGREAGRRTADRLAFNLFSGGVS